MEEANEAELWWVAHFGSTDPALGFNMSPGGWSAMAGWKLTPEARAKMSKAHQGLRPSAETRAKLSRPRQRFRLSEEGRKRREAASMGRVVSEETRAKLVAAQNRLRVQKQSQAQAESEERQAWAALPPGWQKIYARRAKLRAASE